MMTPMKLRDEITCHAIAPEVSALVPTWLEGER